MTNKDLQLEVFCANGDDEPYGVWCKGMVEPYRFTCAVYRSAGDVLTAFADDTATLVEVVGPSDVRHCWTKVDSGDDEAKFEPGAPGDGMLVTYIGRDGVRMPGEHVPFDKEEP